MSLDDLSPVLVGVSQLEQRTDDPLSAREAAREPLDLMVDAVRLAAEDAGAPSLLSDAASVRVIRGMWPYQDPGRVVADAVGNPRAETGVTVWGGNSVQSLLTETAVEIGRGERDIVILTGAECGNTQAKARRAGVELDWSEAPGEPDRRFGVELKMRHRIEAQRGIVEPMQMYAIFENAIRHARGESIAGHIRRISRLWAGFSRVAAGNPHAWIRDPLTAEEIRTPSAANRAVSFPYPKFMNSNSNVDQAAALILTSSGTARRLGIPEARWIHPWAATEGHDTYAVSSRDNLYSAPGLGIAGRRCLALAEIDVANIDHVDLYSCFPSAVQVAAMELGLDQERPLTVTGGLTFGGGPLNNYVMHSIARMAEVLRERPGDVGLVTSNGGFLTKHAFGVYSTEPPPHGGFRHESPQDEIDALPTREIEAEYEGPVEIEGYTVTYDREGPSVGLAACRLENGCRTWGNTRDAEILGAMVSEEFCGRSAHLDERGALAF